MWIKQQFLLIFSLSVLTTGSQFRELAVDFGRNLTIPCFLPDAGNVVWVRKGKEAQEISRHTVQLDGSLFLFEVDRNDSGVYTCSQESSERAASVEVTVRTPPGLLNVTVHLKTILAWLDWDVQDNGGYPVDYFTAQYRATRENETWRSISPTKIGSDTRQVEVFRLEPNTTYAFRVWATNALGKGEVSEVEGHTLHNDEEIELARHFLQGAEKFDTSMWFVAVGVVMGTLVLLGIGTCLLLYQECHTPNAVDEHEVIELVPNIILNPFDGSHTERIPADENANNETTLRLNNNTVIQPRNV